MGGFLYFIDDGGGDYDLDAVAARGLGYAFETTPIQRQTLAGPGSKPGVLLGTTDDLSYLAFSPDKQTWRQIGPSVWVGRWNEKPIAPADLARAGDWIAHPVRMSDGRDWMVPVALKYFETGYQSCLPHRMGLDATGKWTTGVIVPRFARLAERAAKFFEWFIETASRGEATAKIELAECADLATEALSMNHRIGPVEADMLGLFDDRTVVETCKAVIDWPFVMEQGLKKKRESQAGEKSSSGSGSGE